jgi:acyl-CoA synthetase (AMP-forming)/AMP-acid ligase II
MHGVHGTSSRVFDRGATLRAAPGPLTGLAVQLLLLATLAQTVGLAQAGWVVGVGSALILDGTLARALWRDPEARLGPAGWVTLTRATFAVGVAALAASSFERDVPLATFVRVGTPDPSATTSLSGPSQSSPRSAPFPTGRSYPAVVSGPKWTSRPPSQIAASRSPLLAQRMGVAHDAVQECAVVGCEDGDGLTKPYAFVVLRAGVARAPTLAADLQQFVRATLAEYKRPRWVEFRDELPKTATGKMQRFKLREEARRARQ